MRQLRGEGEGEQCVELFTHWVKTEVAVSLPLDDRLCNLRYVFDWIASVRRAAKCDSRENEGNMQPALCARTSDLGGLFPIHASTAAAVRFTESFAQVRKCQRRRARSHRFLPIKARRGDDEYWLSRSICCTLIRTKNGICRPQPRTIEMTFSSPRRSRLLFDWPFQRLAIAESLQVSLEHASDWYAHQRWTNIPP